MDKKDLEKEFIKNPLDMSAAIAQRTVNHALQQFQAGMGHSFDTQVEMARKLARGDDADRQKLFDTYAGEIEASVAQVDVPMRANTTVWRNAADLVFGRHLNDLKPKADDPNRAPAVHVSTGGGPAAPSAAQPAPKASDDKLTPEEQKFARKFRISDAEYLQGKKDNLNQTDPILNPNGPSSWDRFVTFDSREKRKEARRAAAAKK
jgi:hypothetical protein